MRRVDPARRRGQHAWLYLHEQDPTLMQKMVLRILGHGGRVAGGVPERADREDPDPKSTPIFIATLLQSLSQILLSRMRRLRNQSSSTQK